MFVAEEDDVSPFTDGLPILEDRYSWSNTSVSWIQNSWDNGQRYKTSDMSSLIQSVVSRSGWSDGNYICLMIDYMNSNQYRDWNSIKGTWSYNGADLAKLYVDFVVPQEEDTISVLSYKKDIIIDHTKVDDDITNFPLLIDIYDADLKTKAQYDGDDIIFKSGGLQLSHEIELYEPDSNSTHAHLVAWVKTDLSSTVDTTITMLYGDSEITSNENPEAVWTSGFAGVWHLSQDQSGTGNVDLYQDSSSSNNDGNDYVSATGKDGRADGGQQFDGNNDYVDLDSHVGDYASLSEGSISLWFRYSDTSDYKLLFSASCNTDDNSDLNIMYYQPDDEFMVGIREDGGSVWIANFPGSYADGSWHHYTLTVDGSGNNHYIDGNPITCTYPYGGSASTQGFFNNVTGLNTLRFGNREDFTGHQYHFAGSIDEVRISSVARTAGWVSTSFNNQDDPASFLRVGTEQSVQFGQKATLLFTTDAQSVVSILPRMTLTATTQETTLDANMQQGTSFYAINGTSVTWTANVLIDPPANLANTSLILEKQSTWTLQSITDSIGNIRTSEATTTATQVMVPSSVIDVTGMWIFNFTSTNEASDLECAAGGSPYGMTAIAQTGQLIDFRGTASIIPGSAMRLTLVDPNGQVFYASDDLSQDGSGQFEWTGIAVDSSWDCGTWKAHVDFNDTAGASPLYVGRYSREFVVQHVSSLNLQAPGDAVGDQLSVRVAGDLLLVEVHLTDTDTTESIAGSSVTMNWTVSGAPTQVQLEDYGDGTYVKALNTSDLGLPGMWRINIQSSHPYLVDSSTYFDLELSHPTYIYYETPEPTAYTDDFAVKITLYDAINGDPYPSATIASNGTLVGVPTDYGNGTYLVQIDSSGLELGSYGFQIDGSPSQSFVLGSSVNVVFAYRTISTELVQLGASPINVPWGRTVNTTLEWQDFDHGGVGIAGGTLVGDATFQHTDLLDGTYSIEIDVSDYAIGTYLFNFSISRAYYDMGQITVAVNVVPHRTSLIATYNSSVPVGTNTYISLAYYDLDSGSTAVPGNFSSVQAQWSGGSSPFGSMDFWLQTEGWALGSHTLNLTLFATTSPRFYFDANTAVIIEIRKVTTELSWTPIYSFPVGDDFAITLFLNVSEPVSKYDGDSIDGLDVSYFNAEDKDGTPYTIKDLSFLGNGEYLLTIDQAFFPANSYTVRIFVTFGALENFTSTQTPIINFDYSEARSELTSPDYPIMTISYSTDASITLEFIDIDRGQGIDTATVTVVGATELSENLIGSGRYRVVIDSSGWSIGVYTVNFTVSAPSYQDKTISIDIQVRQIRTYAIATVGFLDIPVGDSQIFYVDYMDLDHDVAIFPASGSCNWTLSHYDITWTGSRWKVTITTYDTDTLGSYLLMFDFSAGAEYEVAYFNVSVVIRTIDTELRLVTPAETTTATGQVQITVYYGDRDHTVGIVSSDVSCTVRNSTDILTISWVNGTAEGYYDITIDASQFGRLGIQQLTVIFNWTGSIQKYQNKFILTTAEVVGEDSELVLIDATPATPCLGYMDYTFLYMDSSGFGITNDTSDVYIRVQFSGVSIDLSQIDILEVDNIGSPGYYSVGFNNTILGSTGLFSMKVFINWSQGAWPYYTNRTDAISVRVLPRDTLLSVVAPTSVPFGENATFTFTFEDITGGTSSAIEYENEMTISLSLAEFSMSFDSLEGLFTVSFNTSQFGPPLGERLFTLSVTWSGIPFYANKTGQAILVAVTDRQTVMTYPTPASTPYGDNVTFTAVLTDVAGFVSRGVEGVTISLYDGATEIPQGYVGVMELGQGQYSIELDTSYYATPGDYNLEIIATPGAFYYLANAGSRTLTIDSRETILISEPPGNVAFDTSLSIIIQYLDLNTLNPIANVSSPYTHIEILNGSGWIFTCVWRPSMHNYLLTVETYNQVLDVGIPYQLWLNFSSDDQAPYYKWSEVLVPFLLRERHTTLDIIDTALPTAYSDYANFTVEYKDVISISGIAGGTMVLYHGLALLSEGVEYEIATVGVGQYRISIDTSFLGVPGIKIITVIADWSAGAPHYSDASRNVTIAVTERQTSIEITVPPTETQYLNNVTFDFTFTDIANRQAIAIVANDVRIFSGGVQLGTQDYVISVFGNGLRVNLNSTIISASLVSNWNITIVVTWTGGAPFYQDDQSTLYINTVSRAGRVELDQVMDTPYGDDVVLGLTFSDQAKGNGITGATIIVSCFEVPGLVEGVDYWITPGVGPEAGRYIIDVSSTSLGNLGIYNFILEVRWNPLTSPFYGNVTNLQMEAVVREIQVSISSELPTPSVAAFYQEISFTVSFTDIDHSLGIPGAEGAITLQYESRSEPSSWSVNVISPGVYNISVNLIDSLPLGLQYITVNITMFPYQSVATQAVVSIRNRVGGLSADVPAANYAGEPTYVMVYLVDDDAGGAPLNGATLNLIWGDFSSFIDLGDGSYNVTLFTSNVGFGAQPLTIGATLAHYTVSELSVEIELLAVTSGLIVTWSGPRPNSPLEIYWGEPLTIYAAFNDTLRNQLVSSATVIYSWTGGSDVFGLTGMPGNYTAIVDTSPGSADETILIIIDGQAPNYLNASAQLSIRLLPRPMDVIPEGDRYFLTVAYGGQASIVVYLQDSESASLVPDAHVSASWEYANMTLTAVPGQPGYYSVDMPTFNATFGTYEILVSAYKENYANATVTISMAVSKINMVVWLDSTTAAYEYTPVYWSESVRIGVYVLAPDLNTSDPYSTGLSNCTVRWFSTELGTSGTLMNGSLLGGPGYYYFYFNTTDSTASVHSFALIAEHPTDDYTDAENSTTLLVENLPTVIQSSASPEVIWGWTGYMSFTYFDTYHGVGIDADIATYQWAGGSGVAYHFGNGTYGVPMNTSLVRPTTYPITISFQKINYNDQQLTIVTSIAPVPAEIAVNLPDEYRIGDTWEQLQVPYGDILNMIILYNNTWESCGIPSATFNESFYSGPGFFEEPLSLVEAEGGNYSFVFDTTSWALYSEFEFKIRLSLENYTTAVLTFVVTIVEIPTTIEILGPSIISLSFSNETTFRVFYSDAWPGHGGQGIAGATATITILSDDPDLATIEYVGEDVSNPGWYQFRVSTKSRPGVVDMSIVFNKSYYVSNEVQLIVSISPSQADIDMQMATTFGSAFAIIILLSAIVWVRVIRVPKIIRTLSAQIRSIRRKRVPKPAGEVMSRQEIIAQLFRELTEDLKIDKDPELLPVESVKVDVPELEQLLLDLAILTNMTTEEIDDFRRDLSKMKLSQQTNFITEVIKQEVPRVAQAEEKSFEEVLEDVRLERQRRIGGEAAPTVLPGFDIEAEEAALFAPVEKTRVDEDHLNEKELQEMKTGLLERGLPMHEVDAVINQARGLPKDVAEMLLKSFGSAVDMHETEVDTAKLSDMEIEMLRQQLIEEGAGVKEIDQILEQARDVPRALAQELLKGFRHEQETKRAKKKEPVETMSEDDLVALRGRLFIKGTPEEEIEAIIEQARKVPRELAADFIKEIEEQAPVVEEEIEFEDRLNELEIEGLRKELKKRKVPKKEIEAIIAQAKNLPKALIKDLLDSIDAEKK
ncbi:MAG: LamG-like jellyroll fold domain-containing protein [Candidatus Thorarchaeota archaeon]